MPSVGTAYVDIKVDTKAFDAGLRKALAKAAGKSIDIKVKIDVDDAEAEAALKKIKKSAAEAAGDVDIDVDVDEGDAEEDLARIKAAAIACSRDVDIKIDVDDNDVGEKIENTVKKVDKASSAINRFGGRLGIIVDAVVALAPAIAAVGAVAVPAVTAIGQAVGGLGVGVGTAVLAFKGVGTAIGAMNKAELEPSAANFEKVREAMANLSPEAQRFAIQVQGLGDEFKTMRDSAGQDMFAGMSIGLTAVTDRLPDVNALLKTYGGILGDIAQQAGISLASDRWNVLFSYLQKTGGPTLHALADAFGSLTHGVVELLDAFAPMSQGGLDWLAEISASFDDWATSLSAADLAPFFDYLREVGPQIADTLGAIVMMFVNIGKAVAPMSGTVLNILEGIAKAVSAIADSGLGPALFGSLVAWRTMARLTPAVGIGVGKVSAGMTLLSGGLAATSTRLTGVSSKFTFASTALGGLGQRLPAVTSGMSKLQTGVSKLGGVRGALGVAGLATAATTSSKALGVLSGAASGAALGSLFAPGVGTAIGAVAGGLFGFAMAAHNAGKEMSAWDKLAGSGTTDLGKFKDIADKAQASINKVAQNNRQLNQTYVVGQSMVRKNGENLGTYTKAADNASKKDKEAVSNYRNLEKGITQMGQALGSVPIGETVTDVGRMNAIFKQAAPAMSAVGISAKEWWKAVDSGDTGKLVSRMQDYVAATDSAAAKNQTLADSFAGLDSDIITTADSASQLAAAMEAVFRPAIDAMKGQIAFRDAVRGVNEQIKNGQAGLMNHSKAADENKTAMLGLVDASLAQAKSDANNNATGAQVANGLIRRRDAIKQAGMAAGISGDQMNKFLGVTMDIPAQVRTMFSAPGAENAKKQVQAMHAVYRRIPVKVLTHFQQIGVELSGKQATNLNNIYRRMPKRQVTRMLTDGVDKSNAQIRALGKKYRLTPKQVKTLIKVDAADATKKADAVKKKTGEVGKKTATAKIKADIKQFNTGSSSVNKSMGKINGKTATAKIKVDSGNSMTVINNVKSGLAGIHDKSVTITTNHVSKGKAATGGWIHGPGTGTSDSIPMNLSNGEFVIPAASARRIGDQALQYMRHSGSLPVSARTAARMAIGGVVQPTNAGTLVRIAEAGRAERVTPLDRQGFSPAERKMLEMLENKLGNGGGSDTYNVHPAPGMNEVQLADRVARRVAWNRRRGVGA
jgi:hypothetical protein